MWSYHPELLPAKRSLIIAPFVWVFGASWQNSFSNSYKNMRVVKDTPGHWRLHSTFQKLCCTTWESKVQQSPDRVSGNPRQFQKPTVDRESSEAGTALPHRVQVLLYTGVMHRGKGREKTPSVPRAELISSRFVRVFPPIGHHTLPTWKSCTETSASNFWPRADTAFCSFSDVMWISKERCWTEMPQTLQHEG